MLLALSDRKLPISATSPDGNNAGAHVSCQACEASALYATVDESTAARGLQDARTRKS